MEDQTSQPWLYFKSFSVDAAWEIWESIVAWCVFIVCLIIINYILKAVLKGIYRKINKGSQKLNENFIKNLHRPLYVLLWVVAFFLTLHILILGFDLDILADYERHLYKIGCILCVAWFAIRLWKQCEKPLFYLDGEATSKHMVHGLRKAVYAIIWFFVLLAVLESFEIGIGSLLTIGGVSGLAISLAAKDALANFFGGLIVYLTKTFKVGDKIVVPGKNVNGVVEQIGWYITLIKNNEGESIYVPNSIFSNTVVVNKK